MSFLPTDVKIGLAFVVFGMLASLLCGVLLILLAWHDRRARRQVSDRRAECDARLQHPRGNVVTMASRRRP